MPTDPADIAVAIMLALLVLTPWALWEAERLRVKLLHRYRPRAVMLRPPRERDV